MIAGVLQTMRKLTEHLGMASYDPPLGTRAVIGQNWLTRLGSFMNFDISSTVRTTGIRGSPRINSKTKWMSACPGIETRTTRSIPAT